MQPLTILALLAGSALATYAPGSACNSNLECNSNCIKSQWTIAASGNGSSYRFVCDPAASDDTQYYSSVCNKFAFTGNSYDKGATARACAKVGGLFCASACVSPGTKSSENGFRAKWSNACRGIGLVSTSIVAWSSEDLAKKVAKCG
jgi:hypothetical protein